MTEHARLPDLLDRLGTLAAEDPDRPVVVGLDGPSGAGKSTLARALATATGAVVVEGDDFFAGGTTVGPSTPSDLADLCIDRARLGAVLRDLRAGRSSTYRAFDWAAFDGRLARPRTLEPGPLHIVEGVYSCHPDLHPLLDLKVVLTAPPSVREARLRTREGELGPWDRQWHAAEDWYRSVLMPPERFDLILDSTTLDPGVVPRTRG